MMIQPRSRTSDLRTSLSCMQKCTVPQAMCGLVPELIPGFSTGVLRSNILGPSGAGIFLEKGQASPDTSILTTFWTPSQGEIAEWAHSAERSPRSSWHRRLVALRFD